MHTKLIRMKWERFWNLLQFAGVDKGQVRGPGVLLQEHGMVQDGHDAHQTDQDEVGNVLEQTRSCWSSSRTSQETWCTTSGTWGSSVCCDSHQTEVENEAYKMYYN
jgi:hypothetical protein